MREIALRGAGEWAIKGENWTPQAMSEEQLAALLAKLKEDAGLQEKLQGARDLDAAVALAREVGFDLSKADWLKYQAKQTFELSDEELEGGAGGVGEESTATGAGKRSSGDFNCCLR